MPSYYVTIKYESKGSNRPKRIGTYGLTEKKVRKYTETYLNGNDLIVRDTQVPNKDVRSIDVFATEERITEIASKRGWSKRDVCRKIRLGYIGKKVTNKFLSKSNIDKMRKRTKAEGESKSLLTTELQKPPVKKEVIAAETPSRRIFIVHGKASEPKFQLAATLTDLGLEPVILSEQANQGRTIIEKLEHEAADVGYVFVLLTPDDVGMERDQFEKSPTGFCYRARQNVILELGYFVGRLGRKRVCCLYQGNVEVPSDILGVVYLRFNESVDDCFKALIRELRGAGYKNLTI